MIELVPTTASTMTTLLSQFLLILFIRLGRKELNPLQELRQWTRCRLSACWADTAYAAREENIVFKHGQKRIF